MLQEDSSVEDLWTEIRTTTDFILKVLRCTAQATGRTLGLAVEGQHSLWLGLMSLADRH